MCAITKKDNKQSSKTLKARENVASLEQQPQESAES